MNSSLNVTAIINDEVAAVEISGVTIDGFFDNDFKGVGWAKKHPTDNPNRDIAYNLALSRALQDLANQYARHAADIAGFPVVIDLEGFAEGDDGETPVLVHFPVTAVELITTDEEVSF